MGGCAGKSKVEVKEDRKPLDKQNDISDPDKTASNLPEVTTDDVTEQEQVPAHNGMNVFSNFRTA